jgi:hypothetical protein
MTNPLLHETSTLGPSFWMVLASTRGATTPAGTSSDAGSSAVPPGSGSSAVDAGQKAEQKVTDAVSSRQTAGATAQTNPQSLVAGSSREGNGVAETTVLAQRILSVVTGQSAARRSARMGEKADTASSTALLTPSAVNGVLPSSITLPLQMVASSQNTGVAVAPAIGLPLNNPVNRQSSGSSDAPLAVTTTSFGPDLTAALPTALNPLATASATVALPQDGTPNSAEPGAAQNAKHGAESTEQVDTKVVQSQGLSAVVAGSGRVGADHAALPPTQAASVLQAGHTNTVASTLPAFTAVDGTAAGSGHASRGETASQTPASNPPGAPSQPASTSADHSADRVIGAMASIGVAGTNKVQDASSGNTATPAGLESVNGQTAAASALPAAATLVSAGLVPHLPIAQDTPGTAAQSSQNAVSAISAAHPLLPSVTENQAASPKGGNDANASSDKASHGQSSNSGNPGTGQASAAANQPAQHAADAAQTVPAKTADSAAPMLQAVAHDIAPTQPASEHGAEAARTADTLRAAIAVPADSNEGTASSGINTARLIQTLGETGMQVGMRSTEFGDISIRTMVSQQQMMTQISVDHGDLSRAIAAHVPAIQAKLGDELGMRASIQVNQTGTSFAGEQGNASGGQQKTYGNTAQPGTMAMTAEPEVTGYGVAASDEDRLDIRA